MSGFGSAVGTEAPPSCGLSRDGRAEREHRQFAKVLGGGCEGKFVARAGWTAQSQPIQLQDTFQMGEQHLDLLPVAARLQIFGRVSEAPGDFA